MDTSTASQRIIGAMERNGIQRSDLILRVCHDEDLRPSDAAKLVGELDGGAVPIVVAAAIIAMIADRR